jgi:ElaB/YqjD/DUF883 family membrane-anchored ribosome-binding protein
MSLFKVITGLAWWLAAWLLFAKKSWTEFRKDLEWKTSEQKAEIFWKEILSMWKDVLEELKKLPENEQVNKLKSLWKERLEVLTKEVKKSWWEKIDELLPKLEKTLDEIKNAWSEKLNQAKNEVKKVFKKDEDFGSRMTKIFKK